jgi:DNA polymerase III delta prime subunit
MDSQDQNIEGSSIKDSNVQLNQAGRDAISFQNSHDNKVIITNIFLSLFGKSEPPQVDWDWGMDLLKRKQLPEICKRLTDTLGSDRTLMDVSIDKQPSWVNRPLQADRILQIDGQDCGVLDANQMLIETFGRDDIKGKLLILGAPGAGKTTALLSLAKQLVEGAISNPNTVIPVIFELSTWRDDSQSIKSWLIEQLYKLHGGKRKYKIYEKWLEREVLLPLLDGLDELGLERQKKCTEKLNEFARRYPHLVVCCRVKEFEMIDIKMSTLRGAVCLQPLSDFKIKHYFNSINRPDLWSSIQTNLSLQVLLEPTVEGDPGLLRVPLFLRLIAEVCDPQQKIINKTDLLDKYVDRQLSFDKRKFDRRKGMEDYQWAYEEAQLEPNHKKTRSHLSWLAQKLGDNNVEFLIENIQPTWLDSNQDKYWYRFIFGFILTFSILIPFLFLLFTQIPPKSSFLSSLTISLIFSLVITPISACCFGLAGKLNNIEPVESFKRQAFKEIWKDLRFSLIFGLTIISFCWLLDIIFYGSFGILEGLLYSLVGEIVFIFMGLNLTQKHVLKERTKPNQGIIKSFHNQIWTTILYFVPMTMLLLKFPGDKRIWFIAVTIALTCGFMVGGGMAWLQHLSLRIILYKNGLPWNLARFLQYCEERKLIQSVGGHYRFLHLEPRDYFAPTKISESKENCGKP